jgi:hypothetical protein
MVVMMSPMMGTVVAVVVVPAGAVAVPIPMIVVGAVMAPAVVAVMVARAVVVPLRGGRAGDQLERGGAETDETCLHGTALSFHDEGSLGPAR